MAQAPLYLDEDVYGGVAQGLRRRGFDVLVTIEAGRGEANDEEQLRFAVKQGRVLVTFNRGHFARLHAEYQAAGRRHCGIVVSAQAGIGPVVRALARLLSTNDAAQIENRLIWLDVRAGNE